MSQLFCPLCKPMYNRRNQQIGEHLEIWETNYHGTGEDMAGCTHCFRNFAISYKVDEIIHIPNFDTEETHQRLKELENE